MASTLTYQITDSRKWEVFISTFDEIKKGEKSYALILFNIKNFRYFNAKYGYKDGNEILQMVYDKMQELLITDEHIVNLYADNYALLLHYQSQHTFIYERMMEFVDKLYRIEDERIYRNIFLSCGIYLINDPNIAFIDALNYANISRKESDTLFTRSYCIEVYDKISIINIWIKLI